MKVSRLKMAYSDLDIFVNFLVNHLQFDYENHSVDMSIMASEDFYLRNSSMQFNMIVTKKVDTSILIDIIGGAGGAGLFNLNFWSEIGYIKRVKKVLNEFASEVNTKVEEI